MAYESFLVFEIVTVTLSSAATSSSSRRTCSSASSIESPARKLNDDELPDERDEDECQLVEKPDSQKDSLSDWLHISPSGFDTDSPLP
jgi:hypothetical protein